MKLRLISKAKEPLFLFESLNEPQRKSAIKVPEKESKTRAIELLAKEPGKVLAGTQTTT